MEETTTTEDRTAKLARLRAEAEAAEAEAETAVSPEDAEEHALIERAEQARQKRRATLASKRSAELAQLVAQYKTAARGAYAVGSIDLEEQSEGAGAYVVRSPAKDKWTAFQEACAQANGATEKTERAYNNLASACVLWPEAKGDDAYAAWNALKAKFPALTQSLGDYAATLGGIAATARKR